MIVWMVVRTIVTMIVTRGLTPPGGFRQAEGAISASHTVIRTPAGYSAGNFFQNFARVFNG
jgi:hypothetical protein